MFICHEKEFTYKFIDLINRLVKVHKNYIVSPNFASVKFASLETKFANIAKESNLIPFALYIAVYTLLVINFFHIRFKFASLSPQIRFKSSSYSLLNLRQVWLWWFIVTSLRLRFQCCPCVSVRRIVQRNHFFYRNSHHDEFYKIAVLR